jgi:hypothetical protein
VYLNFSYLSAVSYALDHPLKRRLETLVELNLSRCIVGYSNVLPMNHLSHDTLLALLALLDTHFVGDHIEETLSGTQTSMYSVVVPQELLTRFAASMTLFINDIESGCFFYCGAYCFVCGTLFQPPEKYLILTDSLSLVKALLSRKISHRTHPLVYECKQMCSDLLRYELRLK